MKPLLRNHDRRKLEVIGINCGESTIDDANEIRNYFDKWCDLHNKSDVEAARYIAELELDILVELGGYTGGNRIRILTAKPAPIQLSYLGYFASTHLKCIDGIIGDKKLFPDKCREKRIQDKHYIDYRDVIWLLKKRKFSSKRTANDNYFRFGCFNHSRKLSIPAWIYLQRY